MKRKYGGKWPRAADPLMNVFICDRSGKPLDESRIGKLKSEVEVRKCVRESAEGDWIVPHGRYYLAGSTRHGLQILHPQVLARLAEFVPDKERNLSEPDDLERMAFRRAYHTQLLRMVFDRDPLPDEVEESLGVTQ